MLSCTRAERLRAGVSPSLSRLEGHGAALAVYSTDGVWSSCAASRVFVQRLRAPELLDSIGEQADDQTMTRI